ncbi:MAG: winged helix-turn-helix domain-containing protein, partial [Methanocella sp.]
HIQVQIDVPFDRLKKYLSELRALDFIEKGKTLKVTNKGKEYMQEYEHIVDFIEKLSPRPN